jgi:hypothetical protein
MNKAYYVAAAHLINTSRAVRPLDPNFADILLDKAEEYSNKIKIDEELEKEIIDLKDKIKEGL